MKGANEDSSLLQLVEIRVQDVRWYICSAQLLSFSQLSFSPAQTLGRLGVVDQRPELVAQPFGMISQGGRRDRKGLTSNTMGPTIRHGLT